MLPNLKWERRLGDEEAAHKMESEISQVTRKGGREASERRSGLGEDERQPEMVRVAAL